MQRYHIRTLKLLKHGHCVSKLIGDFKSVLVISSKVFFKRAKSRVHPALEVCDVALEVLPVDQLQMVLLEIVEAIVDDVGKGLVLLGNMVNHIFSVSVGIVHYVVSDGLPGVLSSVELVVQGEASRLEHCASAGVKETLEPVDLSIKVFAGEVSRLQAGQSSHM
jgi:hypothetical protein